MKPGDTLGRYVIEAALGKGGMGEVFEALDTKLARRVALKLLPCGADAAATARLVREARAAAAFHHANAVVVYDVGEEGGDAFIAMELVRGQPLRAFVGDASVPLGRRVRWLIDVARALDAAHAAGLVHRDVKPDNVMIADDGAVKVLDFGIARRPSSAVDPSAPTESGEQALPTLTQAGVVVGTPLYMSPEALRSESIDGRSDQFSWGVLAYQLLSGEVPWRAADTLALLSQILSAEPPSLSARAAGVPDEVVAVVERALSKSASARFETMGEVADALEPFADAATRERARTTQTDRALGVAVTTPSAAALATSSAGLVTGAGPAQPPGARSVAQKTGRAAFVGLAIFGALVVAGLVVAGVTGHVKLDVAATSTSASATASELASPAPVELSGLTCEDATITGNDATAQMKSALGIGACARLATALDIEWKLTAAPKLAVRATLAKGHAAVTLSLAGVEGSGEAATPVDAIGAAVVAISPKLHLAKLSREQIQAWGVDDEASARAIEGSWRKILLNLVPNDEATTKALVVAYPKSPWPHAFQALSSSARGSPEQEVHRKAAIELAERLPPARALGLRAIMRFLGAGEDHASALEDLRKSYRDAPDDVDIAGIYAAIAISEGAEEGFAVLDRLVEKFPTKSVIPIQNAISAPRDRDLDRDARYLGKLRETLPETVAWYHWVQLLAERGKIDEAREALAFGDRFGLSSSVASDASNLGETRAFVELVAFEPAKARAMVSPLLADPRPLVVGEAAELVVASYMLEGRFEDALDGELRDIERARTFSGPIAFASRVATYGMHLRYLGRPPVPAKLLDDAASAAEGARFLQPSQRASFAAVFALLRADPKTAKVTLAPAVRAGEAVLEKTENHADRDSLRMSLLPLVRIVRGDAEAAAIWREAKHASHWSRDSAALEAGFALEKIGKAEEAESAYLVGANAANALAPFRRMIAHVRLAALYRAAGRDAEAAKLEAIVERLWSGVDPAVVLRLKKL